jgi:hypothetical protein
MKDPQWEKVGTLKGFHFLLIALFDLCTQMFRSIAQFTVFFD